MRVGLIHRRKLLNTYCTVLYCRNGFPGRNREVAIVAHQHIETPPPARVVLFLTYANVKDPEFIKLWQRWNHPDPRPELAPSTQV